MADDESKKRRVRKGTVNEAGAVVWTSDAMDKIRSAFNYTADGWANVFSGLGHASRDKRSGMQFKQAPRLTVQKEALSELFHGDDLVARICELIPHEMYREWISIVAGDGDASDSNMAAEILQHLETIDAQTAFTDAEVWARLYGGSVILVGVDDGQQDASLPVDVDKIQSVDWLTVLDRHDIEVESFYEDPLEERYGLPQTYRITNSTGMEATSSKFNTIIHESRTIRFDGTRTSRRRRRENGGWNDTVLERFYEVIRDFQGASGGIMHLLTDFSQAVFKIKGLAKALSADKEGLVLKRLQMLDIARSMVRAVPLDADAESFERSGAAVSGMADLYDRMMMRVSAATGIPVTLLFGRSPAGMNATGESDIRLFYDHIAAMQETRARPRLEYLLKLMLMAKAGPTGGVEPMSWSFTFNPLYQESAKEQAETRKLIAETDKMYVDMGALYEEEVTNSRWGGDTYSPDTQLDDDLRAQKSIDDEKRKASGEAAGFQAMQGFGQQQGALAQKAGFAVVNQENKVDAPGYKLHVDSTEFCSGCAFANGPVCSRFSFVADVGFGCDDWRKREPVLVVIEHRKKRDDGAARRRPRGGRNY